MNKKYIKISILGVCLVAAVFLTVFLAKVLQINAFRSPIQNPPGSILLEEIDITGSNDVLVAESKTKELYINPVTMNLIVTDKASGMRYESVIPDAKDKIKEASLMTITHVGDDNVFTDWDSYTYVLVNESYRIHRIENGVRIDMNFNEGESARFYEILPKTISIDRYKQFFLEGLDAAVERGEIEEKQATKYKNTLGIVYKRYKDDGCYKSNYVASPPISAVKQLIAVAKLVGYTQEELLKDAAQWGYTVDFKEPALFDIALEAVLEGEDLVVRIPADGIKNGNDYFTLQNIQVLPNFCAVASETVTDGYLFVPDGAGALMKMNTYNPKVPDYVRGFYNNDFYADYYYAPEFGQELMMPVFGMLYLDGTKEKSGFLGIVEQGADIGYLEAVLAAEGEGTGRLFNKIFTSYDVSQFKWVAVFGEFSSNTSRFLMIEPETESDYIVRYKLYSDEVSYYQMAKDYRGYLVADSEGRLKEDTVYLEDAKVYLEVLGTLSLKKRILGIPYETGYSMTTYQQLSDILTELCDKNLTVSYLGAFDGGMYNKLMKQAKLVNKNGTEEELEQLLSQAEERNIDLYLGTNFAKVYASGNGYVKYLHAAYDFSKTAATMYGYYLNSGLSAQHSNQFSIVNPKYLVDEVKDFSSKVNPKYRLYLEDLPELYFANYSNEYISPEESSHLVSLAMEQLPEQAGLALDNPRADRLKYGAIAVDIARESSEYDTFYSTIPFRQLVLNGLMEYTTASVNNNSITPKYYLMQALEVGALPKFIVSYSDEDVLKDSYYSYYYSVGYQDIKQDIEFVYKAYQEAMGKIGRSRIVNSTMLTEDVFLTEYENGTKVYVNYTALPYHADDMTIPANDYVILEGR